jgi:CheY-like chemotaxis protein
MAALGIAKCAHPNTPFIFLSRHMGEAAIRRALGNGATECLSKADLRRLPEVIRSALAGATDRVSRGSDQTSGGRNLGADAKGSADYLLQRQAALERSLRQQEGSTLSNLLSNTPPTPAALVLIESATTRDRYLKFLHTADIERDVAADLNDALRQLAARLHALLFTDRLDLIRAARQLNSGSAVH